MNMFLRSGSPVVLLLLALMGFGQTDRVVSVLFIASPAMAEIDDDDRGRDRDDDGEDDDDDLEWNDDDHSWGRSFGPAGAASRGASRESLERIDRELADLRQVKGELSRRIDSRRQALKEAPAADSAAVAVDRTKRQVESAKKEVASTETRLTQAQRDASRLLRQLSKDRGDDEVEEAELEESEYKHNLEMAAGPARQALQADPRYRINQQLARNAQTRLELIKSQQKEGRAGPRELVEAMNELKRANASVELMEWEKLEADPVHRQARQELADATQAVAKARAAREQKIKADPRYTEARAAVASAEAERKAASQTIADAAQARTDAAKKLDRVKAQAKAFEGDVDRMVAAQRAIDAQIIGLEAARKDIEGRLGGQ